METAFGYSYLLDIYGCTKLEDVQQAYRFLDTLVGDVLRMTKQAPPYVFRSPEAYPDKVGISAWVPLIESGVQLHTLEMRQFCSVDCYSCQPFDPDAVRCFAMEIFGGCSFEEQWLTRGSRYYLEPPQATSAVV